LKDGDGVIKRGAPPVHIVIFNVLDKIRTEWFCVQTIWRRLPQAINIKWCAIGAVCSNISKYITPELDALKDYTLVQLFGYFCKKIGASNLTLNLFKNAKRHFC
jgi:hypothetical protein